jgi:microsomal dipeptidase-like Zn-dependent dipeptidase
MTAGVNHVGLGSDYDGAERSVFLVMKHLNSSIGYVNNTQWGSKIHLFTQSDGSSLKLLNKLL